MKLQRDGIWALLKEEGGHATVSAVTPGRPGQAIA